MSSNNDSDKSSIAKSPKQQYDLCCLGREDGVTLFLVNHSDTGQSQLSVSLCMWKWGDRAFIRACCTALWCL